MAMLVSASFQEEKLRVRQCWRTLLKIIVNGLRYGFLSLVLRMSLRRWSPGIAVACDNVGGLSAGTRVVIVGSGNVGGYPYRRSETCGALPSLVRRIGR